MLDLKFEKQMNIQAPVLVVWDVLTNPDHIKKYLFGTEAKSNWQKGGALTFSGEYQGQKYEDHGTILDIEPGEIIKYDYWSSFSGIPDVPENYSIITFKLGSQDNHTDLTLIQEKFVSQQAYEHSQKNWEMVLAEIKKIAEAL